MAGSVTSPVVAGQGFVVEPVDVTASVNCGDNVTAM